MPADTPMSGAVGCLKVSVMVFSRVALVLRACFEVLRLRETASIIELASDWPHISQMGPLKKWTEITRL